MTAIQHGGQNRTTLVIGKGQGVKTETVWLTANMLKHGKPFQTPRCACLEIHSRDAHRKFVFLEDLLPWVWVEVRCKKNIFNTILPLHLSSWYLPEV